MVSADPQEAGDEVDRLRAQLAEVEREAARFRAEADRYRRLVEGAQAIPWEADPRTNRFTYVGPQATRLLGFPRDEWYVPGFWAARLHPEDRDRGLALDQKEQAAGRDHTMECRLIATDGSVVWVLNLVTIAHHEGEPLVSGFLIDVTERKRAEEEKSEFERSLQETQKLESLGVLAGGLAHDFNNLLTSVLGFATLTTERLPADSPLREFLKRIEEAGRRGADLCQQMLAYAGRNKLVIGLIDLSSLVRDLDRLIHAAVSTRATIQLDLAPSLPLVEGDAAQMRQLLLSLVTNASEALGTGTGTVRIATGLARNALPALPSVGGAPATSADWIFLEVSDTGSGMSPETQARIFEPFFTTKFVGRGLGLAAVQGIVRAHHGAVVVESSPGKGSRFRILLPARATSPGAAGATSPKQQSDGKVRVLVVEDDDGARELVRMVLEESGYEVLAAENARKGLEQFRAASPVGLVLLDVAMPGMTGLQALDELRQLAPQLPILLMSGYSSTELVYHDDGQGHTAFLQKPFGATDLVTAVRQMLEK
jgi:PAS domain S-box-containing protein